MGLGDVLELTGKHDEALSAYLTALTHTPEQNLVQKACIRRKCGLTKISQRQSAEAAEAYSAAEDELGSKPTSPAADWWHEWVEIQLDRMWAFYWSSDIQKMGAVAERTQKVIQEIGTPVQVAKFSYYSVLLDFRRERYAISDNTIVLARKALKAARECNDLNHIMQAQFGLGFCHLWRDEHEESEVEFRAALRQAERMGSVEYKVLCLTYLAVLYRKRGMTDEVRRHVSLSTAAAKSGRMPVYVGAAKANMAWLALREGDSAEAERLARQSLEYWEGVDYPIRWLALLPLVSIMVENERLLEAVEYASALIHPSQHILSKELQSLIQEAIEAWEKRRENVAIKILKQAGRLAEKLGYL
jgi:tetratricopeptide (TPR) repeat protein